MIHRSRFLCAADFRSSLKISDEFNNVLNRSGWGFDHVAIDVGNLAGAAGRITRDLIGMDRDTESVKIIHRQITNVILRRIQPKKSLAIFLDGSEPLWKVRHMRLYPGKKFEGKFYRSAASPMVYLLEDKLRSVPVDLRVPPREFVICGPAVPGPVEGKMSAWMLDLATRALSDDVSGPVGTKTTATTTASGRTPLVPPSMPSGPADVTLNDSFCLIGGSDLFLSALGATPFHNITTVTLQQGELKSLSLSESLEWLAMDHLLKGEAGGQDEARRELQQRLSSVRTDIVLLYLLTNGISATDLSAMSLNFKDVMEAYVAEEATGRQAHLFEEGAGDAALRLRPAALERVLVRAARKSSGSPARPCRVSADYLEILLQTHSMICNGGVRNFHWTPNDNDAVPEKQPKALIDMFIGHLRHLAASADNNSDSTGHKKGNSPDTKDDNGNTDGKNSNHKEGVRTVAASVDRTFALTGMETLLVSAPKVEMIEQIIPIFTKGHGLPTGVAADIVNTKNVLEALEKARGVLQAASVEESFSHPAMTHSPSHYFARSPGSRGPPAGWSYESVNLGIKADVLHARYRAGAGGDAATATSTRVMDAAGVPVKNALFVYAPRVAQSAANDDTPQGPQAIEKAQTQEEEKGGGGGGGGLDDGDGDGNDCWREVPCGQLQEETPNGELSTLRVVTWNVQFSRHSGERTPLGRDGIDWCTPTRYVALSQTLEGLDADVIGMQEVEPAWCAYLSRQPWVRERYAMSCGAESHAIRPWGVMLLVKKGLQVEMVQHANVPAFSGHTSVMPEVTVTVSKNVPVAIGSMHLLAPYNQNNINNRTMQLENLTKRMRTRPVATGAIVMGDFNDCARNYFTFPTELGFKDAWSLLHGDNGELGHTIDGKRNTYAGQIIEREFYGRADRVLFASRHLQPIHAELVGVKSVREVGITKQVESLKEVPDYLFPSDHFGVLVEFQVL